MAQLSSCREKLGLRQKDLERAQQTATSDPSCKEDLTEVGDMEIDSDEETMETQLSASSQQAPAVPHQLPPHPTFPHPPKMFNSLSPDTSSASPAHLLNPSPHTLNSAPQLPPPIVNNSPRPLISAPPHMMNSAPPLITSAPLSQPAGVPYSRPYLPPMQGFRPPSSQFSRPPILPSAPHGMMQRMTLTMRAPPSGLPPRFPPGGPPAHSRGPPPLRGTVGPPNSVTMAHPRPNMVPVSTPRLQGPSVQPSSKHLSAVVGMREQEAHIEGQPVLYVTQPEPKSSLDDRLQSLVVKKSLDSVLLQEYAEGEESGDKPYTPTTTPLPASPGDDESVTTPTPQLDASPATPEDVGTLQFNPANPIMKALYHSPTHSPEDVTAAEGDVQSEPAVGEGALLSEVDTGMLQNILKNVQGLKQPTTTCPPPSSSPSAKPSELTSPKLAPPVQTTPTTPTPSTASTDTTSTTTAPPAKTASKPIPSAADIKITSSLTSLLDEIFPQLSKSLQERKRKQETVPRADTPAKQVKMDAVGASESVRPPAQPRLNGPPSISGLPPRGPMVLARAAGPGGPRHPGMILRPRPHPDGPPGMVLRPPGPRPPPEGAPGMILRPPGQRPPSEGSPGMGIRLTRPQPEGMRPRGPPFEGSFGPRGPPRLEGHFRPPRPGMLLVGDRFQRPPGPRPPFQLRGPNSGPPPRQGFPPGLSFPPRGPVPRPPFGQGAMRPPLISDAGMEPNHFAEPPQTHDSLQSIPPSGMGMWR